MKILVVEDEQLLADSLKELLEHKGYEVDMVFDGVAGWEYASLDIYDLLILDVMLPKRNGLELANLCRQKHLGVPILMLTARSELEDRVQGLDAGADYYLTKPFDTRELLACVHALLRRQGHQVDELTFADLLLDLSSATLFCGEKQIRLTAREFDIMRLLLCNQEKNLTKETILTKVWGYDSDAVENHVEVYVGFLRKKLKAIGSSVKIVAVRMLGYHLEVPV